MWVLSPGQDCQHIYPVTGTIPPSQWAAPWYVPQAGNTVCWYVADAGMIFGGNNTLPQGETNYNLEVNNIPLPDTAHDGPLPLWATALLACALAGFGMISVSRTSRVA